jgi:hypothetical protein
MDKKYGEKVWVFPDGDRPREGGYSRQANETLVILNTTDIQAEIDMTIYFTNREPVRHRRFTVEPERVRCLKTNDVTDMDGFVPEYREQYAIRLQSNTEIVAQYLKAGAEDQPLHTYGIIGYGCEMATKE